MATNPITGTGTLLASRRTGMSFQRTRLSADRTLMSIIRTSLSLIGFGFTIYQAFSSIDAIRTTRIGDQAPQAFGIALVVLGIMMLILGILYHLQFMKFLRQERAEMAEEGLIAGKSPYPVSLTLLTAFSLLLIGLAAISNMIFGTPQF
jgi:putative membrane protein